jgi:hypothetical protein
MNTDYIQEITDFLEDNTGSPVLTDILTTRLAKKLKFDADQNAIPEAMQIGGEVDNADTNMEVSNTPMGIVSDRDGAPGPFSGGTGVEDDLEMEVPSGSYVLNAESVQLIGVSDINKVIRDAYTIAVKLNKPMPEDYDPQNKVPIRISNGEAVIPKALVDIIGLDKLEKWNAKGLELRKQKEEMQAKQQQAQQQQGPQIAPEAAPIQAQTGGAIGYNEGDEVKEDSLSSRIIKFIFGSDPIGDVKKTVKEQEALRNIVDQLLKETDFTPQEIEKELDDLEKAEGGTIPSFKEGGFLNWLERQLGDDPLKVNWLERQIGVALEEKDDPFKVTEDFRKKLDSWMDKYNKNKADKDKKDYLNINNALILAETIAMHESKGNPFERQDFDWEKSYKEFREDGTIPRSIYGPARGLYQYEREASEAAKTAVNRVKDFQRSIGDNISWLSEFKDKDYDVRKLTGREQTELFLIDHLIATQDTRKSPAFIDTVNNANLTAEQAFEYWKNHHKRKGPVSAKRRQEFIDNYNKIRDKVFGPDKVYGLTVPVKR